MSLFARNNGSSAVTLVGVGVTIPVGEKSNVTSELRGLSVQQYQALESQRLSFPIGYVWSDGEAEYPIRPLQDTGDFSVGGLKNILLRRDIDLGKRLRATNFELLQTLKQLAVTSQRLEHQIKLAGKLDKRFEECFLTCAQALAGDVVINLGADDTITAAALNAAAAGTIKRKFPVVIESVNGTRNILCSAILDVTPDYTPIATGTGAAPTVPATVTVDIGSVLAEATMITGGGETYEVGDLITVQVAFPGGTWVGNKTVTAGTKTWTVN